MKKLFTSMVLFASLFVGGLSMTVNNVAFAQGGGRQDSQSILNTNLGRYGDNKQAVSVGVPGAGDEKSDSLIGVVKNFVNWALGLLSLIALLVLLYGGFNMVTAAGDSGKYESGFTILKQAAIGLAFIALSWFVLSMVFWLLGVVTNDPNSGLA